MNEERFRMWRRCLERRQAVGVVAGWCVVVLLASGAGCKRGERAPGEGKRVEGPVAVELSPRDLTTVEAHGELRGVQVTGTLKPSVQLEVKAQVSGRIDEVRGERGMAVAKGDVLAVSDDRIAKAQFESMKSQLSAAERDFNSAEVLYNAGAASERAFNNAKVSLESARAQLVQAQETVERGVVRSPISGVISQRAVSVGENVSPGQRLFNIVNSDVIEFEASVLPADMVNVRNGNRAVLRVVSMGDRRIEGVVERIDPVADASSRRVGVYARIDNADGSLVAGLFATGTIVTNATDRESRMLVVPATAVRIEGDKHYVYVVEDDRLAKKLVRVRPVAGRQDLVEVESGVSEGARVVLLTAQGLEEGVPVKVRGTTEGS